MVDLPNGGGAKNAEYMAPCNPIPIHFEGANCLDTSAVEGVIRRIKPDLIVFGASLRSSETVMRSAPSRVLAVKTSSLAYPLSRQPAETTGRCSP